MMYSFEFDVAWNILDLCAKHPNGALCKYRWNARNQYHQSKYELFVFHHQIDRQRVDCLIVYATARLLCWKCAVGFCFVFLFLLLLFRNFFIRSVFASRMYFTFNSFSNTLLFTLTEQPISLSIFSLQSHFCSVFYEREYRRFERNPNEIVSERKSIFVLHVFKSLDR